MDPRPRRRKRRNNPEPSPVSICTAGVIRAKGPDILRRARRRHVVATTVQPGALVTLQKSTQEANTMKKKDVRNPRGIISNRIVKENGRS